MPTFTYRAYRNTGAVEAGSFEADDIRDASRQLHEAQKRPFVLEQLPDRDIRRLGFLARGWFAVQPSVNFGKLFSELSSLLEAGFSPMAALRIVASAEASKTEQARLMAIVNDLANGQSFSQAFASLPGLPSEVVPMLASGESSGKLTQVVSQLAESSERQAEWRSTIVETLTYPIFLVFMVLAATLFLALFLMPAIEPLFDAGAGERPIIVTLFSSLGQLLRGKWITILAVAVSLAVLTGLAARLPSSRRAMWNAFYRLPVVGRLMRDVAVIRYLQTLALMMGNAVPMIDALKLAGATSAVPDLQIRFDTIREEVAKGGRLNMACRGARLFNDPTITLIEIGEEGNNLPAVLKQASVLLDKKLKKSVKRFTTFLGPAITIAMGVLIGGLVVSVMTALLSVNDMALG